MSRFIMIDTTFFEGEAPGIFDYIEMNETGHILQRGQILMKPDIDFEAEYQHKVLKDGDGNVIDDDFGLDDEEVEAIRKDYEESPLWASQSFQEAYPKLKEILDRPDSVVFGESALWDERLLGVACKKNSLPKFSFSGRNLKPGIVKMIHNVWKHNQPDADEHLEIAAAVVSQLCEVGKITIPQLLTNEYS